MARARIVVLGTGAMGCLFAARLARSGHASVTLAGTWREGLDAAATHGLTVVDDEGPSSVSVGTALLTDTLGPADFVLVLVKSPRTSAAAPAAGLARAPGGLVVTLQNGLGNREALEEAVGQGRVAVGVATVGATLLGPARVRAFPGRVTLGAEPPITETVGDLAELFRAAGFPTEAAPDVSRHVWRKLAVNCAVNPLSALHGVANGALLESPETRGLLEAAAREVAAVAAARGIALGVDPAALAREVASRTAGNRSSMLQDLERGAPTEIDALCGAIVLEGRRRGVAVPVNEWLWHQVRSRQAPPLPAVLAPGASRT